MNSPCREGEKGARERERMQQDQLSVRSKPTISMANAKAIKHMTTSRISTLRVCGFCLDLLEPEP